MNVLLVLEANSISYTVIKQLVSIFEGCESRTDNANPANAIVITPVVLNAGNDFFANKIEQVLNDYAAIAREVQPFGYCGVSMAQAQKYRIENGCLDGLNDATALLVTKNRSLLDAYCYSKSLSAFASKQFDKVVTFVSEIDSSSGNLPLAIATHSLFNHQNTSCTVCQCSGIVSENVKELCAITNKQVIITGCISNAHLFKAFTTMQSACAILNLIIDKIELPVIVNARKAEGAQNYTNESIFFPACARTLFRVATIAHFVASMESESLNKMQNRIGLTDSMWNHSPIKRAFEKIADNFNNWQAEASGYEPGISEYIETKILKCLNDINKISNTASADDKINELMKRLGVCDSLFTAHNEINPLSNELLNSDLSQSSVGNLSPTALFELCDSAFTQPCDDKNKRIRSAVLDCWEYYYETFPDNFLKKQELTEINKILSLTEIGRKVLDSEYAYSGVCGEISWITSPATGFAVSITDSYQPGRELKERSDKFRKFMLCYIYLFTNHFSESFRQYVAKCAEGLVDMTTLTTSSLFTMFEQFMNIKIDINK